MENRETQDSWRSTKPLGPWAIGFEAWPNSETQRSPILFPGAGVPTTPNINKESPSFNLKTECRLFST